LAGIPVGREGTSTAFRGDELTDESEMTRENWTHIRLAEKRTSAVSSNAPMDGVLTTRAPLDAATYQEAFESLSLAVIVVDGGGGILARNARAGELFGPAVDDPAARCCDLLGCGRGPGTSSLAYGCITAAVLERGRPLSGLVGLEGEQRATIAATPLGVGVMLQIRPAADESGRRDEVPPPLRIATLGGLALERGAAVLGGAWVHHRPGQVLRYLICARGHRVPVEELVDAIWPGPGREGIVSLRKAVHSLRERLEPERPSQAPSRFVVASPGAYELDMRHVVVDADEFETHARAALVTVERGAGGTAEAQLERAAGLYTGDFLADDQYTEWALAERDRLRALAVRVLRELADLHHSAGRLPAAAGALERLVDLEPLDLANQRDLISLLLRTGQHSSAARRYEILLRRFKRAFGMDPDFALPDLMPLAA
jgi:DNA-binding SARP family transcriptional activator